jgi:hypothetical protein
MKNSAQLFNQYSFTNSEKNLFQNYKKWALQSSNVTEDKAEKIALDKIIASRELDAEFLV